MEESIVLKNCKVLLEFRIHIRFNFFEIHFVIFMTYYFTYIQASKKNKIQINMVKELWYGQSKSLLGTV